MFGFKKKDEKPKKKREYKPAKVVGGGNPWQKKMQSTPDRMRSDMTDR